MARGSTVLYNIRRALKKRFHTVAVLARPGWVDSTNYINYVNTHLCIVISYFIKLHLTLCKFAVKNVTTW